ncbi:lysophosphatidylserine lipase ABHD12-like isoform X2 [Sitophilus oryzae]|uniref:Lysophosphatidylserine lipase ABHD12-like isoform X2 n=1 Tax=Sitophilus oryzae TaxID=7048 RepID=A0A6J2XWF1_SITOR|nr:lysophosphatidylserine lipase ABHD12-like isoform X2 [Sitophilus oryzae]
MSRYNDYYLVNDEDVELDDSVDFRITCQKRMLKKVFQRFLIICFVALIITFISVFIILPLTFMKTVTLQEDLIFTHWNLPISRSYYEQYPFPGFKNHYINVEDIDNHTNLTLGLWHILPFKLAESARNNANYDYDEALLNSNYTVILYFHGTGEDRSQSHRKYQLFRMFSHVIAFDYRYGDSSTGSLSEKNVVSDSIQIYNWVRKKTKASIYVWGHSLGTAVATNTLSQLENNGNASGLILEAPFTNLKDEIYAHPYLKYLSWLPWFEATIIQPLQYNLFLFNTDKHIQKISCPIMFLHAKDDTVVPYYMSEKLYNITLSKDRQEIHSVLHLYDRFLRLDHYFIYQDPHTPFFIYEFMKLGVKGGEEFFEGSHQS